jgi:hypothetical protein
MRFERGIALGERFAVKVLSADPRLDRIILEEHHAATATATSAS